MTNSLDRIKKIITDGLCHRCGSCSGICPKNVLKPDDEYYPRWEGREKDCTDCGLCVKVCPGIGFSFPEYSRRMFGKEATIADKHGLYIKAFLGYSTDPAVRTESTSGGLGTELPRYLLKTGKVKGAFSVGLDKEHRWKSAAFIARDEKELLRGSYSKYPACAVNHLFSALRNDNGPFVYTGLPCHLHGLVKMSEQDRRIGEKIALTIGLYCHSCLEHQALTDMMDIYGISETDITRMIYRSGKLPGYVRARTRDGSWVPMPYPHAGARGYRPNAKEVLTFLFKLYSPMRCRLCIDAMADFADISIGDPWFKGWEAVDKLRQGYNFIIARTGRGLKVLEEASRDGAIVIEPFPEERVSTTHIYMLEHKRMRAFYNIEKRKRRGRPVPEYGFEKRFSTVERGKAAIHTATYFAADMPRLRKLLYRFLLSHAGRPIVGLLFFRRHVIQAVMEKLKLRTRKTGDGIVKPQRSQREHREDTEG